MNPGTSTEQRNSKIAAEQQVAFRAWKKLWWMGFTLGVLLTIAMGVLAIGLWEYTTKTDTFFTVDVLMVNTFLFLLLLFAFVRTTRRVRESMPAPKQGRHTGSSGQ